MEDGNQGRRGGQGGEGGKGWGERVQQFVAENQAEPLVMYDLDPKRFSSEDQGPLQIRCGSDKIDTKLKLIDFISFKD